MVKTVGIIAISLVGIVALAVWGLVTVFNPGASGQLSNSSMITLNGNGIFLLLCTAAIITGAVLPLKHLKK